MKRFVLVFSLVLILAAAAFAFYFQTKNLKNTPLPLAAKIDEATKLKNWNNFTNLSVIDECLLKSFESCFPKASYIPTSTGSAELVFKPNLGQLDVFTVRSILLGDPNYKNDLISISREQANSSGIKVDYCVDSAYKTGNNPLVIFEISKALIEKQALSDPSLKQALNTICPDVATTLSNSQASFEANSSTGILAQTSYSATQKAIISYFYENLDLDAYNQFIKNYQKAIPTIGSYNVNFINSDITNTQNISNPRQDHYYFCDLSKMLPLNCHATLNGYDCYQGQDAALPKICYLYVYHL